MRPVSGVDLVSAALQTSLSIAQKKFNLSNPGSFSKKQLKQEKRRENKLKRKFSRLKDQDSLTKPLLSTPDSSEPQNGDWNDSSLNDFQIEFEPVENEFSSFISRLKEKYICLNSKRKKEKKVKIVVRDKKLNKKLKNRSPYSDTKPLIPSSPDTTDATTPEKDDDGDSGLGLEIFPTNTVSLLQQLRKKKLADRKEKRRKKKESAKLEAEKKKLLLLKERKKAKRMKDISSGSENGLSEKNQTPQLPQPKYVIYPRENVVQGWKEKYHHGCGFHNLGNTCYLNSTLQALFHTPSFVNWLLGDTKHNASCRANSHRYQQCLVCAMANTLKESLNRNNGVIRPMQIHNKLKSICKHFTHCRQEDAHEFLRYLLESMERSYLVGYESMRLDSRSKETTPLGQIFGGYLRTEVTCLKCNYVSTTFQPLAELQLDIRHVTTVEDAMNNHFKKERLDNNDYKCEKCHLMSPATKQFSLEVPPIVLCLQLKRFTLSGGKISKPVHCNHRLNLNRFLHKSLRENHANVQYRLAGLVTHIGSSPNCGHYTAIAEASNGNFYQFDDSFVRAISIHNALNTDAYVIIYEMESTPQNLNLKLPVKTLSSPGLTTSYKPATLNGLKPSSTITKPENSSPFGHLKLPNPFVKTTPSKPVENGNGILKLTTQDSMPTPPTRLLNGYSSSLASLSSKPRTPVVFNIQKNSTLVTSSSGGSSNPKILFKNPNSVIPSTSAYLTSSSGLKPSSTQKDTNGINESNKTPERSSSSDKIEVSKHQKSLFARMKSANSLSQSNPRTETQVMFERTMTTPVVTRPASAPSEMAPKTLFTTTSTSPAVKSTSQVKVNSDRISKLVAYDSDDDSEEKSDAVGDEDNEGETQSKEEKEAERITSGSSKKVYPIFSKSLNISSWSGTESVLSNSMDGNRKRSLEKSKEDLHNEELDSGKVKKSRNSSNSRSKSRSPNRDNSSSSSGTNKFQRYEDNRRSIGEQMQSLQQRHTSSVPASTTSTSFTKPQNGYKNHNKSDNYRRTNDDTFEGNGSSSSSSNSKVDYFSKKGYHYKQNYGYNVPKKYANQQNSSYYNSSSNYSNRGQYNNHRSYQSNSNGWKNNNGRNGRGGGYGGNGNGYSNYGRGR